jgi:dCTP diphosphatase
MEECHMNDQALRDGLAALSAELLDFAQVRDWEQFHAPKNLAMSLAIEAAEVMEHFQWSPADVALVLSADKRQAIALELADVMIYLLRLSTVLGVDLVDAVRKKVSINEQRYPVAKARGRSDKYDEL